MRSALALILAAGVAACSQPASENPPTEDVTEATPAEGAAAPAEEEHPGLPDTDIYLFALNWDNGTPSLGEQHMHLTRDGYDNQPFFSPDSTRFLHTAERSSGETDIWSVDIATGDPQALTDTPDASEYSPQYSPDGSQLTYLYQPPGGYAGHAYIAHFDNSDTAPAHELGPVGYYIFSGDMQHMAVFALGEPNTLQRIDRSTTPETVAHIADNPGRTLIRAPRGHGAFYTVADENGQHVVHFLVFTSGESNRLFDLPGDTQDFAILLETDDRVRFVARAGDELVIRIEDNWIPFANLAELGLTGVTRLAISPDRSLIAIVAEGTSD